MFVPLSGRLTCQKHKQRLSEVAYYIQKYCSSTASPHYYNKNPGKPKHGVGRGGTQKSSATQTQMQTRSAKHEHSMHICTYMSRHAIALTYAHTGRGTQSRLLTYAHTRLGTQLRSPMHIHVYACNSAHLHTYTSTHAIALI